MSIQESATPLAKQMSRLQDMLDFDAEILNHMKKSFSDSKGAVLDPRVFQVQKIILDIVKFMHESDPQTKKEEFQKENLAKLALIAARSVLEKDPEGRAEIAARLFNGRPG